MRKPNTSVTVLLVDNNIKKILFSRYFPNIGGLRIDQLQEISKSQSISYLDIVIDSHLPWDLQIEYLTNKL